MPIYRKVAKEGNSTVINLGPDLGGALGVEPGDTVEVVVIGGFMLIAKEGFPYPELIEAAINHFDSDVDVVIAPKKERSKRSEQAVLTVLRNAGKPCHVDTIWQETGLAITYLRGVVLPGLVRKGLIVKVKRAVYDLAK